MEKIPFDENGNVEKLAAIKVKMGDFWDASQIFHYKMVGREQEGLRGIFQPGDDSLEKLLPRIDAVFHADNVSQNEVDVLNMALRDFDGSLGTVGVFENGGTDNLDSLSDLKVQCTMFADACDGLAKSIEATQMDEFQQTAPILKNMVAGLDNLSLFITRRMGALEDYLNTRQFA